jgi:hypothetical protein
MEWASALLPNPNRYTFTPHPCKPPPLWLQINNHSIRYMLCKDKTWTKALKYMLTDLKFCLRDAIPLIDKQAAPAVAALQRQGPESFQRQV